MSAPSRDTHAAPRHAKNLLAPAFARHLLLMRTPLWLFSALALCSCAGASGAVSAVPAPTSPPPTTAAPAAIAPADHAVARSAVRAVVAQGLGVFLQRVDLDDQPVFVGGKFRGFRIAGLRDAKFWSGVDLKPGDVVTSFNGFPIERPEQAQTAFDSLEVASELRVTIERGGQPRELTYAILEDR
jgi:type II secretory pathway component PulC